MKNIRKIAYVVVVVIIIVLSLTIYTNASKVDEKDRKEKTFLQIKYMEGKIANLLNLMNNVEVRNYSVVTSEMSKATTEKSNSKNKSSGGKSEQGGESSGGGEQSSSQDSSEGSSEGEDEKEKKFELKLKGVLTNTEDINWDIAKSEVENIYTSLPSITMDLYSQNIKQEDILGLNTEYDKLTTYVKDEKKVETLEQLTKVYEYFPKLLKDSGQEELYTTLVETKLNVFKAYAKLDTSNWQEIANDMKNAVDVYSKLLTSTRDG